MLKKGTFFIWALLFSGIYSCQSQHERKQETIKGHWGLILKEKENLYNDYREMYIDDFKIYVFTESVGLLEERKYELSDNNITIEEPLSQEMVLLGVVERKGDTFSIITKDGKIEYFKITSFPLLKDYLDKRVNEDYYWDAFFSRKEEVNSN